MPSYAESLDILTKVTPILDYLNTDAHISESVEEIIEAFSNGLYRKNKEPKRYVRLGPALYEALEVDPKRKKSAQIWAIKSVLAYLCEFLDAHRWNTRVTDLLGLPQAEGEPYVEAENDSYQVLQLKKIGNALYHLKLTLRAVESKDITAFIDDVEAQRLALDGEDAEQLLPVPERPAEPHENKTWWGWIKSTISASAFWGLRTIYAYAPESAHKHIAPLLFTEAGAWIAAVYIRILDGPLFVKAVHRGEFLTVWNKAHEIVHHGHRACELTTEIDPEFLSAFLPEVDWLSEGLKWVGEQFKAEGLQGVVTWFSGFLNHTPEEMAERFGYLSGVLLDQLRPQSDGGVHFPLVTHLTASLGEYLEDNTSYIDKLFKGSSDILSHFKVLALKAGMAPEVLKQFDDAMLEANISPDEEKVRLRELNAIASKLAKAFGGLKSKGVSSFFNFVQYFSIAWYMTDLIGKIRGRAEALSERSKAAIQVVLVGLRDYCAVRLITFCDKLDEGFLTEPIENSIANYAITEIGKLYDTLITQESINVFVPLKNLGPLESETFIQHRVNAARARRMIYLQEAQEIDTLLMPALNQLMARNQAEGRDAIDAKYLPQLFLLIKPHIEAVNPALGQEMLESWLKTKEYLEHPARYAAHHDAFDAVRVRLVRVKETRLLSAKLTEDTLLRIESGVLSEANVLQLASDEKQAISKARLIAHELVGEPQVMVSQIDQQLRVNHVLVPSISKRRAAGYLVWHDKDVELEMASDESLFNIIRYGLVRFEQNMRAVLPRDEVGFQDSPLNIAFLSEIIGHIEDSLALFQKLKRVSERDAYITISSEYLGAPISISSPAFLHFPKYPYLAYTILPFRAWVMATRLGWPYAQEVSSCCQTLYATVSETAEMLIKPYQGVQDKPTLHQLMHHILVANLHIKALALGQSEVYFDQALIDKEAHDFSEMVSKLIQHANFEYSLVRYGALIFDAIGILVSGLFSSETVDKKAKRALQALCGTIYKVVTDGTGLEALNRRVFHNLLVYCDELESRLVVQQAAISARVERVTDKFMEGFIEPLSLPSEVYFKTLVNESAYKDRLLEMPIDSQKAAAFKEKLAGVISKRKEKYAAKTIDRALVLELMRVRQKEAFGLKYANNLYLEALRKTLSPMMQQEIKGEGGVSEPVFWKMYKPHAKGLKALSVFDEPRDGQKPQQGSVRLEAVRHIIQSFEDYLSKQGFWFKLFETEVAVTQKWQLLGKLKALAEDETKPPSARIQALHELMHMKLDDSNEAFHTALQAQSEGFSWVSIKRFLIWFASCFNLCKYEAPSIEFTSQLLKVLSPQATEVEAFDVLYAKDYRRLDAMLEQIKLLQEYLVEVDSRRDKKGCIEDSYENDETYAKKLAWLVQLKKLAENTAKPPSERIKDMRYTMLQPAFSDDMLCYKKVENWLSFEGFKRAILWLLSCVGLYVSPIVEEHKALMHAVNESTSYSKTPLINMSWFNKHASVNDRNYTEDTVFERLSFTQ